MKKIFSIVSPPTFHLAPRSLQTELDDTKFFNQLIIILTKIKTQEIPRSFFASSEDKAIHARDDAYCPIEPSY